MIEPGNLLVQSTKYLDEHLEDRLCPILDSLHELRLL
jgi:hypothetical protein